MKNESTQTEIEAHIRKLIDQQIKAVRDKNIDQALNNYHKDVLSFDVVDPLQFIGIDAIRKRLKEWFSTFQGPIENEINDLKIELSGDVAFCSRLNHVNAVKVDGGKLNMWWRETTCFKKTDGRWMITHVHSSVPFNTKMVKLLLRSSRPLHWKIFPFQTGRKKKCHCLLKSILLLMSQMTGRQLANY